MEFDESAEIFRALGDVHRLKALQFLATAAPECCRGTDSVCACDLIIHLGLAQPTVSHHMRVLTQAGLVTAARHGRWTHYALSGVGLQTAQRLISSLQAGATAATPEPLPAALQAT